MRAFQQGAFQQGAFQLNGDLVGGGIPARHKRRLPRKIYIKQYRDLEESAELDADVLDVKQSTAESVERYAPIIVNKFDGSAIKMLKEAKIDNRSGIEIINRLQQEIEEEDRFIMYLAGELE